MSRNSARKIITFISLAAFVALGPSGAMAHAALTKAEPAANSTGPAPQTITLHFDDALIAKVSNLKLTDVDGSAIAITLVETNDSKTIAAKPTAPLGVGLYTVTWTAASEEDGHKMTGNFSFVVK